MVDTEASKRNKLLTESAEAGIPCDSLNNELKDWVTAAREANGENMRIAIKADKSNALQHDQECYELLARHS